MSNNNKFLKFQNLTVDPQTGKKEEMGMIYIRPDHIAIVRQIWDKYDVIIENVSLLCDRTSPHGWTVKGNVDEIVKQIEETNLYE